MRIIVTKDGNSLIDVINEEVKIDKTNDLEKSRLNFPRMNKSNLRSLNKSHINIKGSHSTNSLFKNSRSSNTIHNLSPSNNNSINTNIEIKQKKVTISKDMIDKYITPLLNQKSSFLPSLPSSLSLKNHSNHNSLVAEEENLNENDSSFFTKGFKMNEILSNKTLINLEDKINKKQRIKNKLSFVGPNDFRSIYKDKDDISIIREKLENTVISNDKLNLIKYINSKEDISEMLIDKFNRSKEDQLQKYNKICQIVSNNQEKENFIKSIVSEKIKLMKKKEESEMNRMLTNLERNLNNYKHIVEDYKHPQENKRYRYFNIHNDIKKNYWSKYNLDRFTKQNDKIERSNVSIHSFI